MGDKIIEKLNDLIIDKPNDLIKQYGSNNPTKKLLPNVKQILRNISADALSTRLLFPSVILRKDKKNLEEPLADKNTRWKNIFRQMKISFFHHQSLKEAALGK